MHRISIPTLVIILAIVCCKPLARAQNTFSPWLLISYLQKAALLIQDNSLYPVSELQLLQGAQAALCRRFSLKSPKLTNWGEFQACVTQLYSRFPDKASSIGECALQGMVRALNDPYAAFMTRIERSNWDNLSRGGSVGGIGVELAPAQDGLIVVSTLPGSPAERSGLQSQDKIIAVGAKSLGGLTFFDAGNLLQATPGKVLPLTFTRGANLRKLNVTAAAIELPAPDLKLYKCGDRVCGYLKIAYFGPSTYSDFSALMSKLPRQKLSALILDLRDNPGGDWHNALKIASAFVSEVPLVYLQTRNRKLKPIICHQPPLYRLPVFTLVNRGTASAAEVLACALRDNHKTLLMGETTFGKALVQTVFSLSGGTAVRFTTAKYLTPEGKDIQGSGLRPDYPVSPDKALPQALLEAENASEDRR